MDRIDYHNEPWVIFKTEGTCLGPNIPDGSSLLTSNDPFLVSHPLPIILATICLKRPVAIRRNGEVVGTREFIMYVRATEDYLEGTHYHDFRPTAFDWENVKMIRPVVAVFHPDHPPFADGFISRPGPDRVVG